LNLAEELGNVSKACQVMGYSRDTFYRYKSAVDEGGVEALLERTRRKPNMANRVDETTEAAVILSATDFPAYGQARTSNELRKTGVFVTHSGVRSIWLRHDLANFKKRLKALEIRRSGFSLFNRLHGLLRILNGKDNCYDNAMLETVFKTIKSELI